MPGSFLSIIVFLPLIACLIALGLPEKKESLLKWFNLATSAILLLIIAFLVLNTYSELSSISQYGNFVLYQKSDWFSFNVGSFGIVKVEYFLGLDALNYYLVALSGLIIFIAAIFSFEIDKRVRSYVALFQLISSAILGSFLAQDFFLFYVFFEFMLLPMFFLIGIWGGPKREYASIKFFLYTLLGSLLILVAMICINLSYQSGFDPGNELSQIIHSFDFFQLSQSENIINDSLLSIEHSKEVWGISLRALVFWSLVIGFLIKLPAFPLHTWLPNAHVEAPTPVSILLASLLLKIGAYGLIRIAIPIFPDIFSESLFAFAAIGVISIIYGGFNALAMKDLKKMIAYSSVSHMGFVLLGLAAFNEEAWMGANYQMLSHGVISGMLFIIAGIIYKRTGSRNITDFSGLNTKMPVYAALTLLAFLAALGLPGFSGFIAEIMVLIGAFSAGANSLFPSWFAVLALAGIFLTASYFIWTMQRMFFGKFMSRTSNESLELKDLLGYEKWSLIALILVSLIMGLLPFLIIDSTEMGFIGLLEFVNAF